MCSLNSFMLKVLYDIEDLDIGEVVLLKACYQTHHNLF